MREWQGDIWDCVKAGYHVVIPTNMQGVMGAGLALQANDKFSRLQEQYRAWCQSRGGVKAKLDEVFIWSEDDSSLILVPTKRSWQGSSPPPLVETCYWILSNLPDNYPIAVPPLGGGLGGLGVDASKRLAEIYLDNDRYLFVSPDPSIFVKYEKTR